MHPAALFVAVLLTAAFGSGCDSSEESDTIDAARGDADGVIVTDVVDEATEVPCSTITIVTGSVVDPSGAPIEGARPQSCIRDGRGGLVCLRPGTTGADGTFAQSVPFENQCMAELTMRVSVPGAGLATSYCIIEVPDNDVPVLSLEESVVLYPTTAATGLPALGDETAQRTVSFVDGAELDLVPDQLFFGGAGGYDELAIAAVDPARSGLCHIDEPTQVAALYAFYPEADFVDGSGILRAPVGGEFAPGETVRVEVLGGLDCHLSDGSLAQEGVWSEIPAGTVSSDGTHVVVPEVPCLTWLRILR